MPALSSLSAGSIVNLPLYGVNAPFRVLGYNSHGLGESVLWSEAEIKVYGLTPEQLNDANQIPALEYTESMHNMFCTSILRSSFPARIRGCLIDYSFQVGDKRVTTSIIQPSVQNYGLTTGNFKVTWGTSSNRGSATCTYNAGGTQNFSSQLAARLNWVRNTVSLINDDTSMTTALHYKVAKPARAYTGGGSGNATWGDIMATLAPSLGFPKTSIYTEHGPNYVQPMVLINGSCQVTLVTSGNYNISTPAAIETYRKINGVWYRTI